MSGARSEPLAPDIGDLLVALASASHTVAARALREVGIDVDEMPGLVDRVRAQARAEDELTREIEKLSEAKEQAIAHVTLFAKFAFLSPEHLCERELVKLRAK